jgi:uncharacterized MnhB-related membrane protein
MADSINKLMPAWEFAVLQAPDVALSLAASS